MSKKIAVAFLLLLAPLGYILSQTYAFGPVTSGGFSVPVVVCSGQMTFNPSSINSAAASSAVTQACTGLATTDNIKLDFSASPLAVTGYAPSANGGVYLVGVPTTNTIEVYAVNNTLAAIDPGSVTLNYRVVR